MTPTPDPLREALARHIGKSGWVRPVGDPPDHDRAWRHMIREAEAMLDDPAIAAALAQPAPALDLDALREALPLPEPEGPGWDDEVRISRRDLHALLNRHAVSRYDECRATLAEHAHLGDPA